MTLGVLSSTQTTFIPEQQHLTEHAWTYVAKQIAKSVTPTATWDVSGSGEAIKLIRRNVKVKCKNAHGFDIVFGAATFFDITGDLQLRVRDA